MAATPAKRSSTTVKTKPKSVDMFKVVSDIDEDGYADVQIFGEPFTIDTDVNGWLLFLAGAGASRDVVKLVRSVIKVTPEDGESFEVARRREEARFDDVLIAQRGLTVEQCIELVNALTEISSGNGSSESSSD